MISYKPVSLTNPLFDEISNKIKESYPKACVLYIDEVVNPILLESYVDRKSLMSHAEEKMLFHGTKSNNVNGIVENGFIAQLNKTSAYGIGTYFSIHANYSKDYTDVDKNGISYIFVCNVLVGECELGASNKRIIKDNAVNNLTNPSIYVTPYDNACYPKYLVAFHKNAAK